jgi:hypothetical protein
MTRARVRDGKWQVGVQPPPIKNADLADTVTHESIAGDWQVHTLTFKKSAKGTEVTHHQGDDSKTVTTEATGPLRGLILGANVTSKLGLECEISEVIIYDRVVDASELKVITAYLKNKWGSPTILPPEKQLQSEALPVDPGIFRTVLRKPGDDGSKGYRIPGLATSNKGTLLAVYDIRYAGFGDLPGDIDVGLRRSTDGGRTWEPQQVIIDFDKSVPNSRGNGVGDPAILVDRKTGAIFVIALWSQGNRAWNGSGPGLTPEETGQLVLVKSTDDGKSWSAPVNLTSKIVGRDPKWRLLFNGPGAGIQARDGTLIFAAQFRDADRTSHSCFLASTDGGETWAISSPAIPGKPPTSESQIAELSDGSLLLSMRDESRSGKRAWARFQPRKTLPEGSWDEYRNDLPDPTCMASLVRHPSGALIFSNPASAKARVGMTLRVSDDDGKTWSAGHMLDPRPSAYSCLTILADGTIGILYEAGEKNSAETLIFANVSLDWIRNSQPPTNQQGRLRLSPYFSEHMVFQREQPLAIAGMAAPQQAVTVKFAEYERETNTDARGHWSVMLPALHASKQPQQLTVASGEHRLVLRDILVGDVWLCAGQSNMEFALSKSSHAVETLTEAAQPQLRLLDRRHASRGIAAQPFNNDLCKQLHKEVFFSGSWQVSGPTAARDFSAIGYEFGRALQQQLDIPIGIISVTAGGSPTEAWIARETLAEQPNLRELVQQDWLTNPAIGRWCRKRGEENVGQKSCTAPRDELGPNHPFKPGFLWSSGIQPLLPCTIRGVLWYQGESNAQEPETITRHQHLFPLLITDWRKKFAQPELPFLYCQLSSIDTQQGYASQFWPEFRDQQRRFAAVIPHTAMAVTSDVGHPTDVHPTEKRQVAQRLLRAALATVYGKDIPFQGPVAQEIRRAREELIVSFECAGQQLRTSDGQPVTGLELGNAQKVFQPVSAQIQANKLVITGPTVADAHWIRYGWQPYSLGNLVDAAALPASTFELAVPALQNRKQQ